MIDEKGENLGILSRESALQKAKGVGLDLIEISASAKPPVARIMSFDKFRYQKGKEEKKQRLAQKTKELKKIRISPRAALNDLNVKARQAEKFLNDGHKIEILIFLRGREKGNKEWNLQKLKDFLQMIKVPFQVTMEARPGGRGFVTQIAKK